MTCRACEQTRQMFARVWRRLRPPVCVVHGCNTQGTMICKPHWQSLPLAMRQRWWRETGYSTRPPSPQLAEEINRVLEGRR